MAPATGVPARFYFNWCNYMATQGYAVLTWDWRGVGDSAPAQLRRFEASMLDWAQLDQPAVLDWVRGEFEQPVTAVGHSFGGQVFGLYRDPAVFDRLVLLASGNAYWRLWSFPGRYLFRAGIGVLEGVSRSVGFLPGAALGLGENLPLGVALQWFDWCKQPDYHGQWDGAARICAPVLSYGFSDDSYAPEEQRRWLLERYGGKREFVTRSPADFALGRIGHLDFFRKRHANDLWPDLVQLLKAR